MKKLKFETTTSEHQCCFCEKKMEHNDISIQHIDTKNTLCRKCIKIGYEAEKVLRDEGE